MISVDLERPLDALSKALVPPPDISVSDWARRNFRLSSEYSAIRGSFEPHPYQVEMLDVLSPQHPCDTVVLMCASQMTKTLIMQVFLGYIIDIDPGPTLIAEPAAGDADAFSKERIAPMLRDIPCLASKVSDAKSRDSGNTILQKNFRGGQVSLTGAIAPGGLARRSVRYLMLDEIDRMPRSAGTEGDPVALASMRTVTFWNRKVLMCSSPTDQGKSRIAKAYADSDQRKYFVPCPGCGHEQVLEWTGVKWGTVGDRQIAPADAHYQCASCSALIPHYKKMEMLRAGHWAATNDGARNPGFHISRLYAPDYSWGRLVEEKFLPAHGDPIQFKTFVNTILAEEWKTAGDEVPDWEKIKGRAENYPLGTAPDGTRFLTAGVDVQKDRLEVDVWGWGRNKESWLVDHRVLYGDTTQIEVWAQLDGVLDQVYLHESGASLSILRMAVDTGSGSEEITGAVYAWGRKHGTSRVMLVKGHSSGPSMVFGSSIPEVNVRGKRVKRGAPVFHVNVSRCKSELYHFLNVLLPEPGHEAPTGRVHTPMALGDEWYKQLVAEQYSSEGKGGWYKLRERNEALDTRNYARACTAYGNLYIDVWTEAQWAKFDVALGAGKQKEKQAESTVQIEPAMSVTGVMPERNVKQRGRQFAAPSHNFGRQIW